MGYHKHFGNKLTKYVQRTKCVYLFLGVQLSMVEAFKRVGEFLLLPFCTLYSTDLQEQLFSLDQCFHDIVEIPLTKKKLTQLQIEGHSSKWSCYGCSFASLYDWLNIMTVFETNRDQ